MSVTAINSGARIATKINKAPGVSVPVTIASHSWNWTRISVAKKTPVPPHRSPNAIGSLRVDRATDDREECLLEAHGPNGGGQVLPQRHVHDFVDAPGLRDDVQRIPFRDALAERSEPLPMVPAVLDRDAQSPTDLPFRFFRRAFEEDLAFLDDVQTFRERLGLVEVVRGEEDGAASSRQVTKDVPHRAAGEGIEPDRRLVQEQQRGLRRHDRRHHRALLLPARQGHGQAVRDLLEPHFLQGGFRARLRIFARDAACAEVAVHLLPRRQVKERFPLLGHDRDQGSYRFRRADDIVAEHFDLAGGRNEEGRGDPKERRLPRAVPAEERDPLAASEGEGHASQCLDVGGAPTVVHLPHVNRAERLRRHGPSKRTLRIKLDSAQFDSSKPGCSPFSNIANAAWRLASFSASLIFTTIATDQMWPNGSWSLPYRSPQNWSSSGIDAFAPAATA